MALPGHNSDISSPEISSTSLKPQSINIITSIENDVKRVIPSSVFHEVVTEGKRPGKTDVWLVEVAFDRGWLSRVPLSQEEQDLAWYYQTDYPVIGTGEDESMACAEQRGWLLIIEGRKAKALARLRSIPYAITQTFFTPPPSTATAWVNKSGSSSVQHLYPGRTSIC